MRYSSFSRRGTGPRDQRHIQPQVRRNRPNNSMEPTRPAGGRFQRDTSLGWPGGSSRGRSADVLPPPTSGSSPQTNSGRGESPGETSMYQGQWPPRTRGPIKFEAALTFITEKASLGSSSNE